MADENYRRKLTAILSADVAGYSRLMGDDEAATVSTLKSHRNLIAEQVQKFNGRVVDSPGDNILSEFRSIVDAISCAVAIQEKLSKQNEKLPENRKMVFRIGVNLGDVIQDGERIYGDGVNIAARIEGLAEPGGIAISGTAFDSVRNKLDYGYEFSGDHPVKNIANPVRVYKVLTEPEHTGKVIGEKRFLSRVSRRVAMAAMLTSAIIIGGLISYYIYLHQSGRIEPASIEKMAFPLPDEPSIAVLPFDNMSKDPDEEYFSDGISEQVITSLSNAPYLFVIARNSSFAFKNKPTKVQSIAEELGVQYILEGSVLRSDDRVRITAQLIDALTGRHLWAETFDRKGKDIFEIYDEITMKIVAELQVELSAADLGRSVSVKTNNLKAYEKYLRGRKHLSKRTVGDSLEARKLGQEAIELDPKYGAAYQLLARTYLDEIFFHRVASRAEYLEKTESLIEKSIEYSGIDSQTHELLCTVYFFRKKFNQALVEGQKAIEFNPNSAHSHFIYGMILGLSGKHDEAIPVLRKAIRLNPVAPIAYLNHLAFAYTYKEEYKKAIPLWKQTLERNPDYYYAHMGLTVAYQLSGQSDKASESAAELIRVKPGFSVSVLEKRAIQQHKESRELFFKGLRAAGLPEQRPDKTSEKP